MQIRPTAFTIGLIIYSFIALFLVYTEFGIDSKLGTTVKIRYYDIDAYTNIEGFVTEFNPPFRRLKVVKTSIPFDDIYTIELLGKDILF